MLYTAFAKRAGLNTNFQEVFKIPEWDTANDEIYIQSRHVNIHLEIYKIGIYDVDIDRVALNRSIDKKMLEEDHVIGLYYGNIAAELLVEKQYEEAFKYFVKGIELAPRDADLWGNLGVLYRRAGYNDHAEKAYFKALELDMRNSSALSNLTYLYQQTGNSSRVGFYRRLAKTYQAKNPYFRYAQAQIFLERTQYKTALDHIKYAINKKEDEARFYTLKSEIYTLLGNRREASKAMRMAEVVASETL